jgi:hypothetical protein
MIQNLLFMTSESGLLPSAAQATLHKPPAASSLASAAKRKQVHQFKFVVCVAGNTIGFAGILASCWLSLQLLQSWM